MVVKSWASLSEHLIENSFLACGQAKTCNPDLISCLKEGGQAADLLPQIQQIWNKNPEIVCSNPLEEECEEELARNEVVIFDEWNLKNLTIKDLSKINLVNKGRSLIIDLILWPLIEFQLKKKLR